MIWVGWYKGASGARGTVTVCDRSKQPPININDLLSIGQLVHFIHFSLCSLLPQRLRLR
jgi:hypothetical protein